MAVEILGGNGLHKAFKELGIKATRTYKGKEKPHYEVWELSKDDLKKLEYSVEWKDEWGWYRYAKGSNMGTPFDFFTVNGKELIAWGGYKREDLVLDWAAEPDEEKAAYPTHETTGGYLKVLDESECGQIWWGSLSDRHKKIIMTLPNFDPEIFKQCTGVDVNA